MNWLTWVLLGMWLPAAYLGFRLGQRVERGKREAVADRLAAERYQRGIRGTVKLSTVKIHR